VNQFHYNGVLPDKDSRIHFRENGPIRYGLFDFDLAIIVPRTSTPRLLPVEMAHVGSPWHHPSDADEGSFYDPFKFDVACMGQMFCFYNVSCFLLSESPGDMLKSRLCWQHFTPIMPLLAPLIHRMSTEDVEYRFTASEALTFCRYVRQTYSDLNSELPSQLSVEEEVGADPWRYLPSEYAEQWLPQGSGWTNIMSP
jgi:hypothetical protein